MAAAVAVPKSPDRSEDEGYGSTEVRKYGVRGCGVRECGGAGVRGCGGAECGGAGVRGCGSTGVREYGGGKARNGRRTNLSLRALRERSRGIERVREFDSGAGGNLK